MKISIMVFIVLILLLKSPLILLFTWIFSSTVIGNFIDRPFLNPFFSSFRLIGSPSLYSVSGFSIRELITFDRVVLPLLAISVLNNKYTKLTKYNAIDGAFLCLIFSLFISCFFSNNLIHAIKVVFDTFGTCYLTYFIGKNIFDNDDQYENVITAIILFGVLLIIITLTEYLIFSIANPLYRVTGPFLYWENLAATLSIILFLSFYRHWSIPNHEKFKKFLFTNYLILLLVCILLAQTRTLITLVVFGLLILSIIGRSLLNKRNIKKWYIIIALITTALIVNPNLIINTGFYQHRLTARTNEDRVESYLAAVRMFIKNPLIGVGLKNFSEEKKHYLSEDEAIWGLTGYCHNSFLVVAAEVGLMGLIPLYLLVYNALKTCLKYFKSININNRKERFIALIMIIISIIYFSSALTFDIFFEVSIDNKIYYLLLGYTVNKYKKLKSITC